MTTVAGFIKRFMVDLPPMLFSMSGTLSAVAWAAHEGCVTASQIGSLAVVTLGAGLIAQCLEWRK